MINQGGYTDAMTCLEIIELRTTETDQNALQAYLATWQNEVNAAGKRAVVNVYKRTDLDTDFSIHVRYDAATTETDVRILGEQLSLELRMFGLVNHTVWLEHQLK